MQAHDEKKFEQFAKYYDLYNTLISLGLHSIVRVFCMKLLNNKVSPKNILDLCTGTGDIARLLKKKYSKSNIIGIDISNEMLKIAKKKSTDITYILGSISEMPFDSELFDIITVFFGLRNVKDKEAAIGEIKRVMKKNAVFLHVDFGNPSNFAQKVFKACIKLFSKILFFTKIPTKTFLSSIIEYPNKEKIVPFFEKHGLVCIQKKEFIFGVISAQLYKKA